MEELFNTSLEYIIAFFEIAGILVVVFGGVEALAFFIREELGKHKRMPFEKFKMVLGPRMMVALDFFLAGDILYTSLGRTWTALGQLAALVAIRIVLTHVLSKEIGEAEEMERVHEMEKEHAKTK